MGLLVINGNKQVDYTSSERLANEHGPRIKSVTIVRPCVGIYINMNISSMLSTS
jgi:hypothetical protein